MKNYFLIYQNIKIDILLMIFCNKYQYDKIQSEIMIVSHYSMNIFEDILKKEKENQIFLIINI